MTKQMMCIPWCGFGKLTDLYDFMERTGFSAVSKPKHFRFIFNSMSNLIVILCMDMS